MTSPAQVKSSLSQLLEPQPFGEWLVLPTSCLYPSRRVVQAYVSGGAETVRVSDGGGAFDELDGHGLHKFDADKALSSFLKKQGLATDGRGWIYSPPVPYGDLPGMIAHVANVSATAAAHLIQKRRKHKTSDLKDRLDELLQNNYKGRVKRDFRLSGKSTKQHEFDFIVERDDSFRWAIDAALPDVSSINSVVVRHMDVRAAHLEGVRQLIIYDDRADWKSEDLEILKTGGRPIAFTQLPHALARLELRTE